VHFSYPPFATYCGVTAYVCERSRAFLRHWTSRNAVSADKATGPTVGWVLPG